jgi:hypothetical protein
LGEVFFIALAFTFNYVPAQSNFLQAPAVRQTPSACPRQEKARGDR